MTVDFNVCADTMTTGSVFHCLRGLPVYIVQRMLAEPLAARHIVVGVPFCVAFADVMLVCGKSVNERSNLSSTVVICTTKLALARMVTISNRVYTYQFLDLHAIAWLYPFACRLR